MIYPIRRTSRTDTKGKLIKFLGVFDTVAGPRDRNIIEYVDLRDLFPASGVQHVVHLLSMHDVRQDFVLKRFEIRPNGPKVLREIWMPGVHSDVGGGYAEDLISSISLVTMAGMLQKLGGIALDEAAREKVQAGIKTKIRDGRLVINAEPSVRLKLTRTSGFGLVTRYIRFTTTSSIRPLYGKAIISPFDMRTGLSSRPRAVRW